MSKKGVSPQNILAVTFTNKAAQEMRNRLSHLLGASKTLPFVGTFHGLCLRLLNEHHKQPFRIIGDDDRMRIISDSIKHVERGGAQVSIKPKKLLEGIVSAKQQMVDSYEGCDQVAESEKRHFSEVYQTYQKILSMQNLCDYEDLAFKTVRLFENDRGFTKKCREQFKFVFVDEYQDLNHGQYCIIKALAPPGTTEHNLCVIGDPDQSIYGFRGSDIKYFKRFVEDYPDAEVVKLVRNYRSTQTILDASYQVVQNPDTKAPGSRVYSQVDGGKTIRVIETVSEKAEAVAVGKAIEQAVGGVGFYSVDFGAVGPGHQAAQQSFSDFAVLYRTADQGRVFSEVFQTAGIPYQVVSRDKTFKSKGIAELISLLKTVLGLGCLTDLERIIGVIKPGISKQSVEIFKQWCFQHGFSMTAAMDNARKFPVGGLNRGRQTRLNAFLDQLGLVKRQTNGMPLADKLICLAQNTRLADTINREEKTREALERLVETARTCNNEDGFFTAITLQDDADTYAPRSEKVALMTIHTAKGLEFPVVFVAGCEDRLLPFQRPEKSPTDGEVEEERRLFYVAMTRAKEQLWLTFAAKRRVYGKIEKRALSPFVNEIEEHLRTHQVNVLRPQKKEGPAQLKLF
jgi:superfamily I DNA/RNA helicase